MIGLETNTLRDKSRRVAEDAEDLIKTTATWASLSNLLKGKKGLVTGVANSNSYLPDGDGLTLHPLDKGWAVLNNRGC
jgi:hypothetical protein